MDYLENVDHMNNLLNLEFQLNSQLFLVKMELGKNRTPAMEHSLDGVYTSLVGECIGLLNQYKVFLSIQDNFLPDADIIYNRIDALENLMKSVCGSSSQLKSAFETVKLQLRRYMGKEKA